MEVRSLEKLKVIEIEVEKLVHYANNAKIHTTEQIQQIKASIKAFGFNDPIAIDEDNVIISGHGRLMAAMELGLEKVPTIRLVHLSKTEKKQYILAHNKLTMNTGFEEEILKMEMEALEMEDASLELTGFSDNELNKIFDLPNELVLEEEIQEEQDLKTHYSKMGDIWFLGDHKLICGEHHEQDIDRIVTMYYKLGKDDVILSREEEQYKLKKISKDEFVLERVE